MSEAIVLVRINCPDEGSARKVAEGLIEARLVACANIGAPVRSLYRWEGRIEDEAETPLIVKTRAALFDAVAAATRDLHPYDVPAVVALAVPDADAEFAAWVVAETRDP